MAVPFTRQYSQLALVAKLSPARVVDSGGGPSRGAIARPNHSVIVYPVTVHCAVKVIRIGNVNQTTQCYTCDFVLVTEWQAPDTKWSPHVSVRNANTLEPVFDTGNKYIGNGTIQRIQRLRGKLYQVCFLAMCFLCSFLWAFLFFAMWHVSSSTQTTLAGSSPGKVSIRRATA